MKRNRITFLIAELILIAIAGILMFAIVYAVDKLVYEMPKVTFIVLVAIAMVLLIVGAIVSRRNHG